MVELQNGQVSRRDTKFFHELLVHPDNAVFLGGPAGRQPALNLLVQRLDTKKNLTQILDAPLNVSLVNLRVSCLFENSRH